MIETTATLTLHCTRPRHGLLTPAAVLVLEENFRPLWQVHPCHPATAPTGWRTEHPAHMLAQGLLAYLAVCNPAVLAAHPGLDTLVAAPHDAPRHIHRLTPPLADHVYQVTADAGLIGQLTWAHSSVFDLADLDAAARNGLTITCATVDELAVVTR